MSQVEFSGCKSFLFLFKDCTRPVQLGQQELLALSWSVDIQYLSAVPDSRHDFIGALAVVHVTRFNGCIRDVSSKFNWLLVICASERMLIKATKAPVGEDWFEICFDSANTSGSDAMFHNHKFPLRISGHREIFKAARPPRVHAIMSISSGVLALVSFHASIGRRGRKMVLPWLKHVVLFCSPGRNVVEKSWMDLEVSNTLEVWNWIQVLYLVIKNIKKTGNEFWRWMGGCSRNLMRPNTIND